MKNTNSKKCALILSFILFLGLSYSQTISVDPQLVGKNVTQDELDLKITGSDVIFNSGTYTSCNSVPISLGFYDAYKINFTNSQNNTFSFYSSQSQWSNSSSFYFNLYNGNSDSILGSIDLFDVSVGDNDNFPYCSVSCNDCFEIIDFSIERVRGNFCSGGSIYLDYSNNSSASFDSDNVFTVHLVNSYGDTLGTETNNSDTVSNIGAISTINSGTITCLLPQISQNMVFGNSNLPHSASYLYITGSSPSFKSENISIPYYSTANLNTPELCVVTVNSNGENQIFWNNNSVVNSASVVVYKETSVSGVYDSLATMSINNSYYIDSHSQPAVKPTTYAVKVIDSCNRFSTFSSPHKTMHLTLNTGQNGAWNLIWSHYSGTDVSSYRIWRGTSSSNLAIIDSVAGSTYTYSDLTPPAGQLHYQIEAIVAQCDTILRSKGIVTSKSNVVENGVITNISQVMNKLDIYPNPFSTHTTIELPAEPHTLTIYDIVGNKVREEQVTGTSVIERGNLAKGVYVLEVRSRNKIYIGKSVIK